ncbi:MAG: hypothetical protein LBF38_07160 [Deltaproteobacteria bacterium]|jgi:exopolyphosphatase/guanosine-5'-triphosphate,3'-diphosphate pyrophosphatase|nr:hypothetical protein [Deltaproteobacteria bacterium]
MPFDSSLAALDLGSNTFRLIIAPQGEGGLSQSRVWQEIPRLSEGLEKGHLLAEAPKRRALEALDGFNQIILNEKPGKILAGGTMVFRQARDGGEFLENVGQRFGWETMVLSGSQEAFLSARGVLSGLEPIPPETLIFDVGGRSTEFINVYGDQIVRVQSLDVGVVGLTEDFIKSDPPRPEELLSLDGYIRKKLSGGDWNSLTPQATLVGTAGTVTTMAAMLMKLIDYDRNKINNLVVDIESIMALLLKLSNETNQTRQAHPGLHPRRADVIVAGLVLVSTIMDYFSKAKIIISDNSLLEGLWLAAAGLVPLNPKMSEVR